MNYQVKIVVLLLNATLIMQLIKRSFPGGELFLRHEEARRVILRVLFDELSPSL